MNKANRFAELVLISEQKRKEREAAAAAAQSGTTVVPSYHEVATTDSGGTTDIGGSGGTTKRKWARPNLEQVNVKIPKPYKAKLEMLAQGSGLSLAQTVVAMVDVVSALPGGIRGSGGTTLLIDDIGTDDDIINLYCKLTGNEWTAADRRALTDIEGVSAERIMIGVALSVARATKKINSFKYCHGAILEAAESPIEDNQQYLDYVKSKLRAWKK